MAVRVRGPFEFSDWRTMILRLYPAASFHDEPGSAEMPERLTEILDELGRRAVFAVSEGKVAGIWVDRFHNYLAIRFSKALGDDFDGTMISSVGGRPEGAWRRAFAHAKQLLFAPRWLNSRR